MNLRQAKSFNKFYKTKKRFVAARGEWTGAPEMGLKSFQLRKKAKKAGMTMDQFRGIASKRRNEVAKKKKKKTYYSGWVGSGRGRHYKGSASHNAFRRGSR